MRSELNEATARQIEAEELMREEGDFGDGMMTEAEMTYLTSMEEVKTISKKLVVAEKAFALVRDRIKNLVAKYEKLLVKIDNEEMATESVVTGVSSCYSSEYASHVSTDYEERVWQRRQQRAEISAELAAREAILSRQQADYSVQEEKQRELEQLHQRLMELQSEPSTVAIDRQRSALLARAIAAKRQSSGEYQDQPAESQSQQLKGGGVDSVKQRFRERMAARMRQQQPTRSQIDQQARQDQRSSYNGYSRNLPVSKPQEMPRPAKPQTSSRPNILSLAGEEMFQHLDFYERSLKAVESQREVR